MNKTITINLGGIVFHIDENAYEQLKKYLEKLKLHFNATNGRDEIIADIENRIAEMFTEKISDSKQVITVDDVTAVITAMGNPEEMTGTEQEQKQQQTYTSTNTATGEKIKRRFYRNPDDKILGGVCGGIASYFDIDPVWVRIAFVVLAVILFGTGVFVYCILWVIIPIAHTTSERLEMRGEHVNINNIEKNVREELAGVKERLESLGKEISSEETRRHIGTAANRAGSFIKDVFGFFFRFVAVIFGVVITIVSIGALVTLSMGLFSVIGVFTFVVPAAITHMVLTQWELIFVTIGIILLAGIPFTILLLNGLKIIFRLNLNLKKIAAYMLIFWLVGLGICIINGIAIGNEYSRSSVVSNRISLGKMSGSRIKLVLSPSRQEFYESGQEYDRFGEAFYIDGKKADTVYVRDVNFSVEKTDGDSAELIINRDSRGNNSRVAHDLAEAIDYNYSLTDSLLKLSPSIAVPSSQKYRGQHVRMILKLPVGKSIYITKDLELILGSMDNVNNMSNWDMLDHEMKMTKDGLKCVDCKDKDVSPPQTIHFGEGFKMVLSAS